MSIKSLDAWRGHVADIPGSLDNVRNMSAVRRYGESVDLPVGYRPSGAPAPITPAIAHGVAVTTFSELTHGFAKWLQTQPIRPTVTSETIVKSPGDRSQVPLNAKRLLRRCNNLAPGGSWPEIAIPVGQYGPAAACALARAAHSLADEWARSPMSAWWPEPGGEAARALNASLSLRSPALTVAEGILSVAQTLAQISAHRLARFGSAADLWEASARAGLSEEMALRMPFGVIGGMSRQGLVFRDPVVELDASGELALAQWWITLMRAERASAKSHHSGESIEELAARHGLIGGKPCAGALSSGGLPSAIAVFEALLVPRACALLDQSTRGRR